MTKWIVPFSEGSKDMRDLLGGKGANVAEMTRVLGEERVPAGFTITTEACVAYMEAGREFPEGLEEQVAESLGRLEQQAGTGILECEDASLEPTERRFSLPSAQAEVLLDGDSMRFLGAAVHMATAATLTLPALLETYRGRRVLG